MKENKVILSLVIFLFGINTIFAQKEAKSFETSKEYCDFLYKKFDIPPNKLFYISTEGKPISNMGKFGQVLFVTSGQIATINEVSELLQVQCAPKELVLKITQKAILDSSGDKVDLSEFVFKNVKTGEKADFSKEDKFVIYVFSQRFGKSGTMYLKERKEVEETLGYKTLILSIDGPYITEIKDVDKTLVNIR